MCRVARRDARDVLEPENVWCQDSKIAGLAACREDGEERCQLLLCPKIVARRGVRVTHSLLRGLLVVVDDSAMKQVVGAHESAAQGVVVSRGGR